MIIGYCRLSRDDNQQNIASIDEQKSIINNYAKTQGWAVDKFYVDDNYSGFKVDEEDDTIFDRPEFKELWEEVKKGNISKILVKDLSRLGRNSPIIQIIIRRLQNAGVGLIDIDERKDITRCEDDFLPIKTWMHEQYVKDISRKVRQSMLNKQKEGRLIMGNYFGYIKKDKTTLIVDEMVRPCIELIYQLYIEGNGYIKIATYLNENTSFPTPSQYYERKHEDNGRTYKHKVTDRWEGYHIQNILQNDVYTGTLRTHKKQTRSIRGYVKVLPESEHFVFENHHEAIISIADWELVQDIRKKRDKNEYKGSAKNDYLFKGFTICGECGYHVAGFMLKRKVKVPAYNCSQFTRYGAKGCGNKETKEADLLNHFKAFLIDTKTAYAKYLSSVDFCKKEKDNSKLKDKLVKEYEKVENELKVLINQRIQAIIREAEEYKTIVSDTYTKLEDEKKQRILELKQQIRELQSQSDKKEEQAIRTAIDVINEIINSDRPSRKLLETILDKIIFHKDRILEYKLKVNIDELSL